MQRRQLIRNVASASMITMIGASTAAAQSADGPDAGDPKGQFVGFQQDDGSYEFYRSGDVEPTEDCCYYLYCSRCETSDCPCCQCG